MGKQSNSISIQIYICMHQLIGISVKGINPDRVNFINFLKTTKHCVKFSFTTFVVYEQMLLFPIFSLL